MDNPKAIISLKNISHNIQQIRKRVNQAKILAVLKADAYGHGAVKIANFLENDAHISAYGVSRYSEALDLYNKNIKKPILLMEGVIEQEQLFSSIDKNFWLVIHSIEQLEMLNHYQGKKPANIWLKFDTGMNRLGFSLNWVDEGKNQLVMHLLMNLLDKLIKQKKINNKIVIMSHFASADEIDNPHAINQLEKFYYLSNKYFITNDSVTYEFSMANSAGIFGWPQSHFDWVRPGICMYGSSPLMSKSSNALNLKPSMFMSTKVISIKNVKAGDFIGYGATRQLESDTLVAIIACGYADCYSRLPHADAAVWLNNKKCFILGRVSMDMIAIDCSHVGNIKVGDEVELWGDYINIDEVAYCNNTLSYEIYTRITARVVKEYVS